MISLMKPKHERTPDRQYHDLLKRIMDEGRDTAPIHTQTQGAAARARGVVGHQIRYRMENGFPLITERDASKIFKGALGEHIGFLNGAHTLEDLKKYGMPAIYWDRWVTKEKCAVFGLPEGELGPGSYGAAWASFPTAEGAPFNQIAEVVRQIKERPYLRTHFVSPWIPQYALQHSERTRKVVVAPCHGWMHIFTYPDTKEVVVHHFQRSADVPIGVVSNIVQYAAFGMMLAQVIGYTFTELVHTFSDAHIYHNQFDAVKELLSREPKPFPTVALDPSVTDIFAFRPEHFTLSEYEAHPPMQIPTAI